MSTYSPNEINPPNLPHARPIDNSLDGLIQKVYEAGWEAKTGQLIRRIESKMEEFDTNFVESLLEGVKAKVKSIEGVKAKVKSIEGVKAKVKSIGDNGVYALFK